MRRGPTYDAKSLQDSAPRVQQTRQPRQNQAQHNEPLTSRQPENPQTIFAASLGRGRGRGRGIVPNHPLRRPGMMQQQHQSKGEALTNTEK